MRDQGVYGNRVRLSLRLSVVAASVGRVDAVADIGSDHALVPLALVGAGTAKRAVAVEVSDGPLHSAERAVAKAGAADRISVRRGDGLEPIAEREVQAVVIAGMGAPAIWRVITQPHALSLLAHGPRLIVQPMGGAGLLRFFADLAGMRVIQDARVKEDGFLYECLSLVLADNGQFAHFRKRTPEQWLTAYQELAPEQRMRYWCGEVGLAVGCDLLREAMSAELRKLDRTLFGMRAGAGERAERRRFEVQAQRTALAELVAKLPGQQPQT